MKTKLASLLGLLAVLDCGHPAAAQSTNCFPCTQVIGYSQVGALNGWFVKDGVFESIVGTDGWQLIWENGATLHDWQRPDYPGWTNTLISPCSTNSLTPDRVLLNLSGTNDTDVAAWVNDINATIDTILLKLPSVRQIILQPIVGGPAHQTCVATNGNPVRASVSHPYMDAAIALVVAARAGTQPEVIAGISPEVRTCADYRDDIGHFNAAGAVAAAELIGNYYAALDANCGSNAPPCPTPLLSIRHLTNDLVELSWPACPSNFYQVEWTGTFQNWRWLTPPLAAPPTNSSLTWTTAVSLPYQFFRLVTRPLTNSPVPTAPGVHAGLKLTHGGIVRNYRLNIPAGYTGATPAPLMLALHGHNQTADEFAANQPLLANYANAQGVILVFPDATASANGTGWNAHGGTSGYPVDDVGFLLALIERLDTALNIDRKRVYAGGFSNGGQMCHHLGAATTNVFAALAAVGSAIASTLGTGTNLYYQPPPSQPMPVLIVNATNDCKRPFWGGVNEDGDLQPPAFAQAAHWTNGNACVGAPVLTTNVVVTNHVRRVFADSCAGPYPPFNAPVTNLVIREHYQLTCAPGSEVLFVTLTDGGHKWPEADDNVGFDASREVLDFFLRHCRCDATGATDPLVMPTAPGVYDLRLCDQNYSRLFRLLVPTGYVAATATPIVFAMPGGGQTMLEFATQHPALFAKANAENILLVLPEALDHPRTREPLWMNKPFDYVVDDRIFFTNLLERIAARLNVDRQRVYACGFSGGGSFCHWLAATTPGVLAAIAPVCTQTGWNEPDENGPIVAPPAPLEPIAVLMVRGTLDQLRPFNGGANVDGVQCRSAADDTAYWTAGNACVGAPVITSVGNLQRWEWLACSGTTEVELVAVGGMGHLWPDAADGFNYDANVRVIDFLLQHSR